MSASISAFHLYRSGKTLSALNYPYGFFLRRILLCILLLVIHTEAYAINKCTIDGKTVYQDATCSTETVAQSVKNRDAMYQQLDRLQEQGVGVINRSSSKQEPSTAEVSNSTQDAHYVPMTKTAFRAKLDQQFAGQQEKTNRKNAESAAKLTQILDEAKQSCDGKLSDYPVIGMTDGAFRNCTIFARVGGVTQIVVSQYGSIPLRLYVYASAHPQRIYSINGIITAIKQ